jgi:hypothetical protein
LDTEGLTETRSLFPHAPGFFAKRVSEPLAGVVSVAVLGFVGAIVRPPVLFHVTPESTVDCVVPLDKRPVAVRATVWVFEIQVGEAVTWMDWSAGGAIVPERDTAATVLCHAAVAWMVTAVELATVPASNRPFGGSVTALAPVGTLQVTLPVRSLEDPSE